MNTYRIIATHQSLLTLESGWRSLGRVTFDWKQLPFHPHLTPYMHLDPVGNVFVKEFA